MNTHLPINRRSDVLVAAAALLLAGVVSLPAQQPPAGPPAQPTPEQTAVITAINAALTAEAQAVTTASTNLVAATLAVPRDNAKIAAANDALAAARLAWSTKASQLYAAQQATVIKMGPAATTQLVNSAPGGAARGGGRGPSAPAPTLVLTELPKAVPEKLWNGVDFTGWELVAASSARGGGPQTQYKGADLFKVVQEDGEPAIWVGGQVLGGLDTLREFGPNYHLHLQLKFVPGPVNNNTGILYHSSGQPTQSGGAWMQSYEFELNVGGMGREISISGVQQLTGTMAKGAAPNFFSAERPMGQWNMIDLYCFGDKAVHVVNGIPVLEMQDLKITDNGVTKPNTRGRLQLQSEAGQLFYRDITFETIDRLPTVIVK